MLVVWCHARLSGKTPRRTLAPALWGCEVPWSSRYDTHNSMAIPPTAHPKKQSLANRSLTRLVLLFPCPNLPCPAVFSALVQDYDGGDCCACTCEDTPTQTCGEGGFACIDPSAPCVDDDDITVDMLANCDFVSLAINATGTPQYYAFLLECVPKHALAFLYLLQRCWRRGTSRVARRWRLS